MAINFNHLNSAYPRSTSLVACLVGKHCEGDPFCFCFCFCFGTETEDGSVGVCAVSSCARFASLSGFAFAFFRDLPVIDRESTPAAILSLLRAFANALDVCSSLGGRVPEIVRTTADEKYVEEKDPRRDRAQQPVFDARPHALDAQSEGHPDSRAPISVRHQLHHSQA